MECACVRAECEREIKRRRDEMLILEKLLVLLANAERSLLRKRNTAAEGA